MAESPTADGAGVSPPANLRSASPIHMGFTDESDWDATMADMEAWATTLEHAEEVFTQVAVLDGDDRTMSHEELLQAYKGDEEHFAALYADGKGDVSLEM